MHACNGVALSMAVTAAIAPIVPVGAINVAAAMATVINGGNHLGRWGDCTGQRPGSLLRTDVGCQAPSEWTHPSAHEGKMRRQPRPGDEGPWLLPVM